MGSFKGIIALDIDGTITASKDSLELTVGNFLNQLIHEGWQLVFITGRTFSFAWPVLKNIEGTFFLAVQNGAALYQMPERRCIDNNYLKLELLAELDALFKRSGCGLLVESGYENADICYYKPKDFSEEELEYIAFRIKISPEKWEAKTAFAELPLQEFAVGKFFASESSALEMKEKLITIFPLRVIIIRDPFRPGFHLGHINHRQASKGHALEFLASMYTGSFPIIAAGDDYNDVEMLEKSTIKVVMENGPEQLKQRADIVAPSVHQQGIITGLKQAIWKGLSA